jgi:site-specific recombinase XerD
MLEELQRRNYSQATTRSYIFAVKQFAEYFGRSPEKLGAEEIRRYQLYLLNEKKYAPGTVEIRMSALRFLYKKTLKRRDLGFDDLVYPKRPQRLPVVLSPEEVTRLIEATPHPMHRAILMVLYGTGIRRTEASLLKVSDIDSQRMVMHIRQGKGSRDRDVPLSSKLLEALREYWRLKKPKLYLFPSTSGHRGPERPISDKTVWHVCKGAAVRAGIKKRIGPHTLRRTTWRPGLICEPFSCCWDTRTWNIRPSICTSRTVTCMRRSTRSINSRSNRRSQRINLSDPATLGGGRRHPHRWQ